MRSPHDAESAPLLGRFDIVETRITLAGRALEFLRPRSADDLLNEEEFERDERIPYWAEIWPSARVLADQLVRHSGAGRRCLELGCGVGTVCLAALVAGFQTLGTDYYADALAFTRLNAARNSLPEPGARLVDWRDYPADLVGFDVVAAADVLYEKPYAGLVAAAMARSLAPGGLGLVADPGRPRAKAFPDECRRQGLEVPSISHVVFDEGPTPVTIDLYEVRCAGGT
jgi:ETFB lysine methyltransferase